MKRVKKFVSIMLSLLFVVSMFTACKNDDADQKTNAPLVTEAPAEDAQAAGPTAEPTATPTVVPTATPEAPQELTLGLSFDNTDPIQTALQKDCADKFSTEHPDYKIVTTDYSPYTIMQSVESNSLPVVFENFYGNAQKMIEGGFAADITDLIKERGWADSMNPSIKELISKDGRIFGIPCNGSALGLMYNAALFKAAGIVDADGLPIYPKTWEELAQTGKKIKEATGAAGFCLLASDNAAAWQFTNIALSYGATLTAQNPDGTYTSGLDSAEAIAAMEYVKSLKWDYDILTADPANENYITVFTQLGTGKAAMCLGANDAVEQPTHTNGLPAKDLGLAPLPAGPDGKQYSLFDGYFYMFSKEATEEQINAALDYLTIMGKGPVFDSSSFEADCKYRAENGIPIINSFPYWTDQSIKDQEAALIDKYSNVDLRLYQDFFDFVNRDDSLRTAGPGEVGQMYIELTSVIQAVIADKNSDVAALMKKADENYQAYLDASN